jgi:hypothetical protein
MFDHDSTMDKTAVNLIKKKSDGFFSPDDER